MVVSFHFMCTSTRQTPSEQMFHPHDPLVAPELSIECHTSGFIHRLIKRLDIFYSTINSIMERHFVNQSTLNNLKKYFHDLIAV